MAPEGTPHRFGSRRSRCLSLNVVGFSESPKSGSTAILWTAVTGVTAFQNALIPKLDVRLQTRVLKSDGSGRRTPNFTADTMPAFVAEIKRDLFRADQAFRKSATNTTRAGSATLLANRWSAVTTDDPNESAKAR